MLVIVWPIRILEALAILFKGKIQYKIIKYGILTSSIREVEMLMTDNFLKRHHHVEASVIIQDKFHKQIPTILLKEWLKVKSEHNQNIQKYKNRIIMKTLINLKLIQNMLHHLKRLPFWKHMIRGQLGRSYIKVFQERGRKQMLIRYFRCRLV